MIKSKNGDAKFKGKTPELIMDLITILETPQLKQLIQKMHILNIGMIEDTENKEDKKVLQVYTKLFEYLLDVCDNVQKFNEEINKLLGEE